jgi:hypothetical protein
MGNYENPVYIASLISPGTGRDLTFCANIVEFMLPLESS